MVDKLIKEGIFVIHALKGYEFHENRIIQLFKKNGLDFEFVTEGDPSLFTEEVIEKYFVKDIHEILSKGVLSCTLNHIYAYERIVSRNIKYAIVFENDPFFLGRFVEKIKKYSDEIEKLPKGFVISLENSTLKFPSYWDTKSGKNIYKARAGRMAGAYLIDYDGAKNILKSIKHNKCNDVIDWWHNGLIDRGVVDMYWAHPPLVEQGSHNGYLNSTISTKPSNLIRRISWLVQKNYKFYFKRIFKEKHILTPPN